MLKVLFLGQKTIGERCFEALIAEKKIKIIGAVSNITSDTWWGTRKIHDICQEKEIFFIDNAHRNEAQISRLLENYPEAHLISVQHPWILPSSILKAVEYKALNLHMAKLPNYKGWNGFSHAILNDDKVYTVTFHWMTDRLDEGDHAYEDSFPIQKEDTAVSLYKKAEALSLEMFQKMLKDLLDNKVPRLKQKGEGAFYGKDSLVSYKYIPIDQLEKGGQKIIRALYFPPYPPSYTILEGVKINLIPAQENKRKVI